MSENYSDWSTYQYVRNNPIRRIDPNGMNDDEYIFNAEGKYTGKVEKPGEDTGFILGSDNSKPLAFTFADPINDPKAIESGEIKGIEIVSDEAISEVLEESGVNNTKNQNTKVAYILNESDASSLKGEGKMDYVVTSKPNVDGVKQPISPNRLYITQSESGAVAHNSYNFGNFLWGAGAEKLGFSLPTARMGAHVRNLRKNKQMDSKDDQRSIRLGYGWSKSNK